MATKIQSNATAAWIATALSCLIFPIACWPLLVISSRKRRSTFDDFGPSVLRSRTLSSRLRVLLWILAVVAQIGQILVAVITAIEAECEGKLSDHGSADADAHCLKNQLSRGFTILEVLVSPVYPTAMIILYLRLDPLRQGRFWTNVSHLLVAWMVFVTTVLMISDIGGMLLVTVPSFKLLSHDAKVAIALVEYYENWSHHASDVWFFSMLVYGVGSLYLTIRIMPWLQRRHGTAISTTHDELEHEHDHLHELDPSAVDMAVPSRAADAASSGTVVCESPSTETSQDPLSKSANSATHVLHPHISQSAATVVLPKDPIHLTLAHAVHTLTSSRRQYWSTHRTVRGSKANPNSTASQARLNACLRRLKAFLVLILAILIGNSYMVLAKPFPFVLFSAIGWNSCRLVSVLLFAATREIRRAALTRRMVPNSHVGTLAESGWKGEDPTSPSPSRGAASFTGTFSD